LMAQGIQTGMLTGSARDADKLVLPGVTVTVTSPALQGPRTTVTDGNGRYVLRGLPPGRYQVSFEMSGMKTVNEMVTVELGRTSEVDALLNLANITETVTVKGETTTAALVTPSGGANFTYREINALPVARTIAGIAELSPGLTNNTPNAGQVTISGAFAYDNVFLIDGVDVNDNLFGTSNNLFIEDAIEETQVLTSGISAEYGRFSGGVINAVTKSGGNAFSGSFRANLTNDSWTKLTPYEISRSTKKADKVNKTYEGTLGGPIMKDRLWFFGAMRWQETVSTTTMQLSGAKFDGIVKNRRYEGKLTGRLAANHTIQGTYTNSPSSTSLRRGLGQVIDTHALESPQFPNNGVVVGYNGVVKSNLFAELRWSRKKFGFRNTGGTSTDIVDSPIWSYFSPFGSVTYNAPYWDATDPEDRNNQQVAGSLSWFKGTHRLGSHDIKGGFESFRSTRTGGNSQTASGYVFEADYKAAADGTPIYDSNGYMIPMFAEGATELEQWMPVRGAKINITTNSFFIQDRWAINRRMSVNAGVRYERVRGEATGNIITVDTDTIVPRLAGTIDIAGDGKYLFQATYSHYAGKYSESQFAQNTNVGSPDELQYYYIGPSGEGRNFAPGFNPNNYVPYQGDFPTANVFMAKGLSSPVTREFTTSLGAKLGKGYAKVIYTKRSVGNFVEDFVDLTTGTTTINRDGLTFGPFTNRVYRNTSVPKRDYQGLLLEGRYPITSRWSVNGHWTVQLQDEGNFEGEGANQPGSSTTYGNYPEILTPDRNFPMGNFDDYQRSKIRLWTIYSLGIGRAGTVDASMMYRYDSPTFYSLTASSVALSAIQKARGAAYPDPPTSQTLYFGARGSQSYDSTHLFDFAANYNIPIWKTARPWLKVELYNLFNSRPLYRWNTAITADNSSPKDDMGLPTLYKLGSNYGKGTSNGHYPTPRRFQMAFGFRF
ncbi:MAG: TonB-dependent receptor, partial [Acidobacteria bacterium]|nr:TonB-dependent receptor [Acidobacteriota bacterium]